MIRGRFIKSKVACCLQMWTKCMFFDEFININMWNIVNECVVVCVWSEMKALDRNDELTPLGRILAKLPIEPRLGKMIIYGCIFLSVLCMNLWNSWCTDHPQDWCSSFQWSQWALTLLTFCEHKMYSSAYTYSFMAYEISQKPDVHDHEIRLWPCVCLSCGDALCTIAASTTFPEPFITPTDRRRLGWIHKSLSGSRCSDHVALLNAFQAWEEAR